MRTRLLISFFAVATLATVAWIASRPATTPPDVEPVATETASAERAAHLELSEPASASRPERAPDAGSRAVAETDPHALVIEVLQSDRTPLVEAEVYIAIGETVVEKRITDALGVVLFDAQTDSVDVYVLSGSALRTRRNLENGAGRHTIVLDAGTPLAGTVILDGERPGAPFALQLVCERRDGGLEFTPDVILDAERRPGTIVDYTYVPSFSIQTDADGRFRVDGLRPTWTGRIDVGHLHALEDESSRIELDAPRSDLVLRVHTLPSLRGRIVTPSGRGAAGAHVALSFQCDDGDEEAALACNDDGQFGIALPCVSVLAVRIACRVAGVGQREIEVRDVSADGLDIGELVLHVERRISFTARDSTGEPIAGAVLGADDSPFIASEPSDERGRGAFGVRDGAEVALVCRAPGYEDAHATIPRADERVDFELAPLPGVDVRVHSKHGPLPKLVRVIVASWDAEPFVIDGARRAMPDESELSLASKRVPRTAAERADPSAPAVELAFTVPRDGTLRIPNLVPRSTVELCLVDIAGTRIATQRVEPPASPLRIRREFVLDAAPRTLELAFVRPDGTPEPRAKLYRIGEFGVLARAARDGVAKLEGLCASEVSVMVRGDGIAPQRLERIALTGERTRREVVVSSGRTVVLHVVDTRGAPVAATSVSARTLDDEPLGAAFRSSEGHFEARDAPEHAFVLSARVAGRTFQKECAPSDTAVDLVVPDVGKLRLEFEPPLGAQRNVRIVLESNTEPSARLHESVPGNRSCAAHELAVVFAGTYKLELLSYRDKWESRVTLARRDGVLIVSGETTTLRLRGDDFTER
ncbi:MAG: hypothetical protein ACKVWV_03335 [Planctomycetota bacterium]